MLSPQSSQQHHVVIPDLGPYVYLVNVTPVYPVLIVPHVSLHSQRPELASWTNVRFLYAMYAIPKVVMYP